MTGCCGLAAGRHRRRVLLGTSGEVFWIQTSSTRPSESNPFAGLRSVQRVGVEPKAEHAGQRLLHVGQLGSLYDVAARCLICRHGEWQLGCHSRSGRQWERTPGRDSL